MSEKIKNHFQIWKLAYILTILVFVIGGVMYFTNNVVASGAGVSTIVPTTDGVDNVVSTANTEWTFGTTPNDVPLSSGDMIRFYIPTTTEGTPFTISNPTITGSTGGFSLYTSLGPDVSGVSTSIDLGLDEPGLIGTPFIYGYVNQTVATGTAFTFTFNGINNGSVVSSSYDWYVLGGTPTTTADPDDFISLLEKLSPYRLLDLW